MADGHRRRLEEVEHQMRQAEHRRQGTSDREAARHQRRRDVRGGGSPAKPQQRRRSHPSSHEQKAYRAARDRANRKISVTIHGIAYFSTLALILVATRSIRVTAIVGLGWGIGFAIHYFVAVVVPELRERWIREEV